jgi:hypothetical protein
MDFTKTHLGVVIQAQIVLVLVRRLALVNFRINLNNLQHYSSKFENLSTLQEQLVGAPISEFNAFDDQPELSKIMLLHVIRVDHLLLSVFFVRDISLVWPRSTNMVPLVKDGITTTRALQAVALVKFLFCIEIHVGFYRLVHIIRNLGKLMGVHDFLLLASLINLLLPVTKVDVKQRFSCLLVIFCSFCLIFWTLTFWFNRFFFRWANLWTCCRSSFESV